MSTAALGITTSKTADFQLNGSRASFIFSNIDGSISAWNGGGAATVVAHVTGASFTGLAIGNIPATGPATGAQLYAADQNSGNIDVFNNKFQMTTSFSDPNYLTSTIPGQASLQSLGFNAFNVQDLLVNGKQVLFVTYANQSGTGGVVDEFSTSGTYLGTLINDIAGAHLDAPWGLAIAPSNWGVFSGDLLVANNNGPGTINAYTLGGVYVGSVTINVGPPGTAADLWGISFGNGGSGGLANTLYFTAGLASQGDGLFGALSVPEPSSAVLGLIAAGVLVGGWRWKNRRRVAMS